MTREGEMEKLPGVLGAVRDFMGALTLAKVGLALLAGMGSVALASLWESRAQWSPAMWQSQTLLLALLVGVVILAVGATIWNLQKRGDTRIDNQITSLQREIEFGRTERINMQTQITELTVRDRQCQDQVRELSIQLAALRKRTTPGDL